MGWGHRDPPTRAPTRFSDRRPVSACRPCCPLSLGLCGISLTGSRALSACLCPCPGASLGLPAPPRALGFSSVPLRPAAPDVGPLQPTARPRTQSSHVTRTTCRSCAQVPGGGPGAVRQMLQTRSTRTARAQLPGGHLRAHLAGMIFSTCCSCLLLAAARPGSAAMRGLCGSARDSPPSKCTCVCPHACTCVLTCDIAQTPSPSQRHLQGMALLPSGAPQHLVKTWPGQAPGPSGRCQLGIWWEEVSEQPDSMLARRFPPLVGPPGAQPPAQRLYPEPPTAAARPPCPQPPLTWPGLPGVQPPPSTFRMAWTRGVSQLGVVQQHWPVPGKGAVAPEASGEAHPLVQTLTLQTSPWC